LLKNYESKKIDKLKIIFFGEIIMFVKFDHSNIVKYFDHFYENKNFYIILKYVEASDLESYLKKSRAEFPEMFYHFFVR
jgi:serine/threonine protein kinase